MKNKYQYKNGEQCMFISAVCGIDYTLYKVSGETIYSSSQLIYAHSNEETFFLNIGKRSPVPLFSGSRPLATIGSVFFSPRSTIECLSLPDCGKAVKVACRDESGKVFVCRLKAANFPFSKVVELDGIKIKELSGIQGHFLPFQKVDVSLDANLMETIVLECQIPMIN